MPIGPSAGIAQPCPGACNPPGFDIDLNFLRHVISGSLAFVSLSHTCRDCPRLFLQRSPRGSFTHASCGCCGVDPGSLTPSLPQIRTCASRLIRLLSSNPASPDLPVVEHPWTFILHLAEPLRTALLVLQQCFVFSSSPLLKPAIQILKELVHCRLIERAIVIPPPPGR